MRTDSLPCPEASSVAEFVACAESDWAGLPFAEPWSRGFEWRESDLDGMRLWYGLRSDWGEHIEPEFKGIHLETAESIWAWWWAAGQAPYLVVGIAVSVLALGAAWWAWRRELPSAVSGHAFARWPELAVLQQRGASKAVLDVVMSDMREQLIPTRAEKERWRWSELNEREQECAGYIVRGLAPEDVARIMHCTPKHVYNLRSNIRKRLALPKDADLEATLRARADT